MSRLVRPSAARVATRRSDGVERGRAAERVGARAGAGGGELGPGSPPSAPVRAAGGGRARARGAGARGPRWAAARGGGGDRWRAGSLASSRRGSAPASPSTARWRSASSPKSSPVPGAPAPIAPGGPRPRAGRIAPRGRPGRQASSPARACSSRGQPPARRHGVADVGEFALQAVRHAPVPRRRALPPRAVESLASGQKRAPSARWVGSATPPAPRRASAQLTPYRQAP